jgi:hypothetical protein
VILEDWTFSSLAKRCDDETKKVEKKRRSKENVEREKVSWLFCKQTSPFTKKMA